MISRLARPTRNLEHDPRASLLIDGTAGPDDPLTGGLTLAGEARATNSPTARHAYAQAYAALFDFAPYAFDVSGGHYIGGFGRIVYLVPPALSTAVVGAGGLVATDPDILISSAT